MMVEMKGDTKRRRPWRPRRQLRPPTVMLLLGCFLLLNSLAVHRVDGHAFTRDNTRARVTNEQDNKRSLRYGSSYEYAYSYMKSKSVKGSKSSKRRHGYHYYGYKSSKSSKSEKYYGHYGSIRYHDYYPYRKRPSKEPDAGEYAAPSYFKPGYHSPVSYPKSPPKSGYGHAPSDNGGVASPSYFGAIGGGYAPSGRDPDPWGGGGNHAPSSHGYGYAPSELGGYASPSYFSSGHGTPSYADPDPWYGGGAYSPTSYWNPSPVAYYGGGHGAPHSVGYGTGHKSGYIPVTQPGPVKAPVQDPASIRNPDLAPTTTAPEVDFRIPGSPAIAPSAPLAPFGPFAPSAETPSPIEETPAPSEGETPAPDSSPSSTAPSTAPSAGAVSSPIGAPFAPFVPSAETPAPNGDAPSVAPSEVEDPTSAPVVPTPAPNSAPVPITSEDMPTFNSGDMPTIMDSNDVPTMIITGPDGGGSTPNAMPAAPTTDSTPSPEQNPAAQGNGCPEGEGGAGCDMCTGSKVADPDRLVTIDVPGLGNTETATCGEWFGVGCEFVEPEVCPDYQEALRECCANSPPVEPTPRPPVAAPAVAPSGIGISCFDPAGCDICGDERLVDDSKIVTIDNPENFLTETATCGEWFLFGCGFVEPDACDGFQDVLTECCTGPDQGAEIQPVTMYTPAMTPSQISPAMFNPAMLLTPTDLTPAMVPVLLSPSATLAPTNLSERLPVSEGIAPVAPSVKASDRSSILQVSVEPFTVRFVGDFELTVQTTLLITNSINGLMASYLETKLANVLESINLAIDPKTATDESSGRALRQLEPNTTALFGISGSLDFSSDSEEDLEDLTTQSVTNDVKSFFTGTELEKLFFALSNNGLSVDTIEMHDGSTDSIVTDEGPTTQTTNNGGGSSVSSSGNNTMTAVIIATLCGGFVFIVLAVAMFVNVRKRKRKFLRAHSAPDNLNLRSGQDELPDTNGGGSVSGHVSFPHLLGEEGDEDDLEYMDDDTLRAIKGHKKKKKPKKKSRREDTSKFHDSEQDSWASISISSDKKGKKKRKKSKKHVHSVTKGGKEDIYLSPLDI